MLYPFTLRQLTAPLRINLSHRNHVPGVISCYQGSIRFIEVIPGLDTRNRPFRLKLLREPQKQALRNAGTPPNIDMHQ